MCAPTGAGATNAWRGYVYWCTVGGQTAHSPVLVAHLAFVAVAEKAPYLLSGRVVLHRPRPFYPVESVGNHFPSDSVTQRQTAVETVNAFPRGTHSCSRRSTRTVPVCTCRFRAVTLRNPCECNCLEQVSKIVHGIANASVACNSHRSHANVNGTTTTPPMHRCRPHVRYANLKFNSRVVVSYVWTMQAVLSASALVIRRLWCQTNVTAQRCTFMDMPAALETKHCNCA